MERLWRHSDGKLYAGASKVKVIQEFGPIYIHLRRYNNEKNEKRAILRKGGKHGANAYLAGKATLGHFTGEFSGKYFFYRIDESDLANRRKGLELKFD